MDYRKIIEFGKSSYVVSLPKDWLASKNLGKGDVVYVNTQGDSLIFSPVQDSKSSEPKKTTIDVKGMSKDQIKLRLISKYIQNYNEITLVTKDMQSKAKDIRAIIHDIMALEVVEETSSKIVTRDFIHMDDLCPLDLLRKMDAMTREMISDSKGSFKEDRSANIAERDTDVNRLSYLFFRKLRSFEKEPQQYRKLGWTNSQFLASWVAAVKIENIADDTKRIAKLMVRLKLKKTEQEHFLKLYSAIEQYYIDGIDAFHANDCDKAFKLIGQKKKLIKQCRDFYRVSWNHEWVPVILEKMKSMIISTKSLLTYICDMETVPGTQK